MAQNTAHLMECQLAGARGGNKVFDDHVGDTGPFRVRDKLTSLEFIVFISGGRVFFSYPLAIGNLGSSLAPLA